MANGGRTTRRNEGMRAAIKQRVRHKWTVINWCKMQILKGRERADILDDMKEKYGYTEGTCNNYLDKAANLALNSFSKDCDKIMTLNLARLESIIEDNMEQEEGDENVAMKAMDMQNKMIGAYTTKVDVKAEGEGPTFKIKID